VTDKELELPTANDCPASVQLSCAVPMSRCASICRLSPKTNCRPCLGQFYTLCCPCLTRVFGTQMCF
jgi:hypothetical protein